MKNGFISHVIPKTVMEDRLGLKSKALTWTICPWSYARGPLTHRRELRMGLLTPFYLPVALHFDQIVHCILKFGDCFFFPFPFKSFNDKKTSEACCKIKFLNDVESQMISSKIIQILLRFFLVLRCCR